MKFEELKKISSLDLAEYILMKHGPMSHLKLQKLLFYCDAYHLAYFDVELIPDTFEAWMHGPVCRKVFQKMKGVSILYGDMTFDKDPVKTEKKFLELTSDQRDLVTDVLNMLAGWTGLELENATHSEDPWLDARKGCGPADKCNRPISKEATRLFYKKFLTKNV